MRTFVKFDYLSFYSGGLSFQRRLSMPIFKDMNRYCIVGECQLVVQPDEHRKRWNYYGVIDSDEEIDRELYFYYLRDEDNRQTLSFQGINLSTKRLTNYHYRKWRYLYYPYRLVITEPPYLWKHMLIDEIPGGWKEGKVLKMW